MSGKVGSRLFPSSDSRCLAMSARKWFRRLPWWKSGRLVISKAAVEIPIVFPVLLYYPELRPTRRAQYGNCDSDWQCALPFIRFLAGRRGHRDFRRQERREAELITGVAGENRLRLLSRSVSGRSYILLACGKLRYVLVVCFLC